MRSRQLFFPRDSFRARRGGSALLIILGCVALLTILVVAFLVTARTEFTTSNFYAKGVNTKLLSENVINLVMAQLREGARSTDPDTKAPQAWASQPGMIRTYDATGGPSKFFKLYSSDDMVGPLTVPFNGNADAPASGWGALPNIYTDLNEPITTSAGVAKYPIIDPNAQGVVEGFSLNAQDEPGINNTAPMPVKWLYVLKNGALAVGTTTTGTAVSVAGSNVNNPIIGRVAFWTDDETCKVNINTASEGTFWDQPIANNYEDLGNPSANAPPYGFSTALPAVEEYQRIPGHPAQTSLSPIFGYGTGAILPDTSKATWPLDTSTYSNTFAPYYSLTPRYAAGGSMGGSQPPNTNLSYAVSNYRLYDSIDELAFDPSRSPLTGANAALYPNATPPGRSALGITPQIIDQRRFFITAHSRAPEETLFGTPRISLWPLQAQTQARTAKDNLLAFCSTVNNQPYYFQRATYFQYIPGPGGSTTTTSDSFGNPSSSSQSTTQDFPDPPTAPGAVSPKTGVQRNEDIYGYLQALTGGTTASAGSNIPGFGGNFLNKYPGANGTSDRDEILTEMFDLLRCGVNTINLTPNIYPNYTFTLYPANLNNYSYPGAGSAVPIAINTNPAGTTPNTHGLGRTYNIAEVAIGFMPAGIDTSGLAAGTPDPATFKSGNWLPYVAADTTKSPATPPVPRRISIGPGLPWACEVDSPVFFNPNPAPSPFPASTPIFLYWDTATKNYGTYYYDLTTQKLFVNDGKTPATPLPSTAVTIGDPQTTQVQAYLVIRPYCLLTGIPLTMPKVRIRVSGLQGLTLDNNQLNFPSSANAVQVIDTTTWVSEYSSGGLPESWSGQDNNGSRKPGNNDGTNPINFPLISQVVPLTTTAYPSPYGGEDPEPNFTDKSKIQPPTPVQIHIINSDPRNQTFAATTMNLNGAPGTVPAGTSLKIDVFDGFAPSLTQAQLLQTVYVYVPPLTLPTPSIEMSGLTEYDACEDDNGNTAGGARIPGFGGPAITSLYGTPPATPPANYPNGGSYSPLNYYWQMDYDPRDITQRFLTGAYGSGQERIIYRGDVVRSFVLNPNFGPCGDMRLLAANPFQSSSTAVGGGNDLFIPLGSSSSSGYADPTQGPYTNLFIRQLHSLAFDAGNQRYLLGLVQTFAPPTPTPVTGPPIPYVPIGTLQQKQLGNGYGGSYDAGIGQTNGSLFVYPYPTGEGTGSGPLERYAAYSAPVVTPELKAALMDGPNGKLQGDWTDGLGSSSDGPFISKPDEGNEGESSTYANDYYQTNQNFDQSISSYSPNRQVPSPVIFGTLPSRVFGGLPKTGVSGGVPWCTLLFCPNPACNDGDQPHPGFGIGAGNPGPSDYPPYVTPPDHLWLDLFWMPVVDPYAISEPFSTAGKINLNYEIVPFGNYIHRSTALHAVMKATKILAVPTQANDGCPPPQSPLSGIQTLNLFPNVKAIGFSTDMPSGGATNPSISYRYNINLPATIDDFPTTGNNSYADSQFYTRFISQGDIFRSASEICNIFLVPQAVPGATYYSFPGYNGYPQYPGSPPLPDLPTDAAPSDMESWWSNFKLTGDNGREMPYKYLYPRLTTKSNDFQVHMRVQVLSQTAADRANGTFDAANGDSIVGQYRGSAIVERYLDPNDTTLPDFATAFPSDPTVTLDNYIHYRIVSTQAFTP